MNNFCISFSLTLARSFSAQTGTSARGNTEKIWAHRFLRKQKTNIPKARKPEVSAWENDFYYDKTA